MTQFVYEGKYKEYRGYVFANGNPVTIKDEATDRMLRVHPEFKIFEQKPQVVEEAKPVAQEIVEPVIEKKKMGRPAKVK